MDNNPSRVPGEHQHRYKSGIGIPVCFVWFERSLLNLVCSCVGTLGRGKLVDDLSPSQFDSLVKVLSLPSSVRDFKFFLTPTNLQGVFD